MLEEITAITGPVMIIIDEASDFPEQDLAVLIHAEEPERFRPPEGFDWRAEQSRKSSPKRKKGEK